MIFKINRISLKILFMLAPFFIVLLFLSGWLIRDNMGKQIESEVLRETDKASNQLAALMANMQSKTLETLTFIADDPRVKEAYKLDDETAAQLLTDYALPLSNSIGAANEGDILRLHFHRPPAKSLLRLWSKKRFDDLSSFRHTILRVAETKQSLKATEIGRGGVAIRSIVPIIDSSEYLGSVELFFNPFDILPLVTAGDTLFNNFYVVNKDLAETLFLEEQLKDAYEGTKGNYYISKVENSTVSPSKLFDEKLAEKLVTSKGIETVLSGETAMSYIPMLDYSGSVVGFIVLSKNLSLQFASIDRIIIIIYSILLLLGVALLIIINRLVSKRLKVLLEANTALTAGNFEYFSANSPFELFLNKQSEDEIAILARSFSTMQMTIKSITAEIKQVTEATIEGRLDKRGMTDKFAGEFKEIIQGLNHTLDAVIKPLNITAEYIDRISKGDIPHIIEEEYLGDYNEIKNNINKLIQNLDLFVADMTAMYNAQKEGNSDHTIDSQSYTGVFASMASGVNNIANIHINNVRKMLSVLSAYSVGDFSVVMEKLPGNQAEANEKLDVLRDSLLLVINELNQVSKAVSNGSLATRLEENKFRGAFKEIATGVNITLDSVITPLKVTADYVDMISHGNIPDLIAEEYKGDFNLIKLNLNQLISNLNEFIESMQQMYNLHLAGDIEFTIDVSKFQGAYQTMADGVNKSVLIHVQNELLILDIIKEYAEGNFAPVLKKLPGKQVLANERCDLLRDNLLNVVSELDLLASEIRNGNLSYSCDTNKFRNGWKELVEGLNNMKESVAKPVNAMNSILLNISKNDYDITLEKGYTGIWLEQQQHTKEVIEGLRQILQIARNVSNGKLEDLEHLVTIGKRSQNDELIPAFVKMIQSIQMLVSDATRISVSAAEGKLDERADTEQHNGEFKQVIIELNKSIDNLVKPLRIAAAFADATSKGEHFSKIEEQFLGEYKVMADNINDCLNVIENFAEDIKFQTQSSINGELDKRAASDKYLGNWQFMIEGMNNIMDAMAAPLHEAGNVLGSLASGDLTVRMQGLYSGEFDELSRNINKLGSSLQDLILNVIEVVNAVSDASNEISANSSSVASASQMQTSQAEEIAAAMEEMARTVIENADNAANTSDVAKTNGNIASEGRKIVSQTVTKMQDIAGVVSQSAQNIQKLGESGKQIGQIIAVIEEIADQTNLLALNAAIEAARAGEQGRGFAVVADEVRKLAERTTDATKQISVMIKGVQEETQAAVSTMNKGNEEVKLGIKFADEAGESLSDIVQSTNQLIEMIMHIAAASDEQSSTTAQVAKNITGISSVSQETSEQISYIAEAANRMTDYTSQLNVVVNQFKINTQGQGNKSKENYSKGGRYLNP